MKSMAISEFKAHALKVIDGVANDHESIMITKRGKPLAQVVPFVSTENKPKAGKLASTFLFEHDIITPLGKAAWESAR
jgi:prevent-host-death family protein